MAEDHKSLRPIDNAPASLDHGAMQILCYITEIPDGQARGFSAAGRELIVLRQGFAALAFENRCPHVGLPLDWQPGQFLSRDGAFLQCANHGALFDKRSGHCVYGPCAGRGLTPVAVVVENGRVILDE